MRTRSLLVVTLWLGCTVAPAETRPPPATTPATPVVADSAPAPTAPPAPVAEPEPTGDRLFLAHTACYGPCPVFELTLFPDGRVIWHGTAHVSRIGTLHATIAPELAAELYAAAGRLDFKKLPQDAENASCGSDLPGIELTLHRGAEVHRAIVNASCTVRLCDERGRKCSDYASELTQRGLSRKVMISLEQLAMRVNEAVGSAAWIDDPACRELASERVAPGLVAEPAADDDYARQFRDAAHARVIAALQRDPQAVVRIAGLGRPGLEREFAQHRKALQGRGVAADRIGTEVLRDYTAPGADGIVLTVGPRECLGAAFPPAR